MKKIYLSLAVAAISVLSLNAQNNKQHLSEDVLAGMNMPTPVLDLSQFPNQKNTTPSILSPTACDTLGTTFGGTNSHNGNMFDLTNNSAAAIQIISFDQCFNNFGTADTVKIYSKTGTFAGFESTPGAWTFEGSTVMTPVGSTSVPIAVPITLTVSIPASGTVAFYITRTGTNYVAYTNGSAQGSAYKTKNSLEFKEGKGNAYPFGASFGTAPGSRIWNGVINYCSPLITGVAALSADENLSTVYPNPMTSEASVLIASSVNLNNATLKVYDMSGRVVYSMNNINSNGFKLNHNLNSGLYIVQVENNNTVVLNKKISVQ